MARPRSSVSELAALFNAAKQPLYVLETRTGGYLCAGCSLEVGVLVAHPYLTDFQPSLQFRNRDDAEATTDPGPAIHVLSREAMKRAPGDVMAELRERRD